MSKNINKIRWPWAILFIFFIIISLSYLANFYHHRISSNPGDWGAMGDYFGGLFNPLILSITLFFLIKAYTTQKQELSDAKDALKKTEEHARENVTSQKQLIEIQIRQSIEAEKLAKTQHLLAQIDSKYKHITFLQKELERVTEAKVNIRHFVSFQLKSLNPNEMDEYREKLIKEITGLKEEIDKINSEAFN